MQGIETTLQFISFDLSSALTFIAKVTSEPDATNVTLGFSAEDSS